MSATAFQKIFANLPIADEAWAEARSSAVILLLALVIGGLTGVNNVSAQTDPWVAVPDGELDSRFGTDGIAPTMASPRATVVQFDGKMVVVSTPRLARHNVDGSLDQTFGLNGIVEHTGGRAVVLQADGKIVVAGTTLARFNPDGSPDANFGTAGSVTIAWPADAVALGPEGEIVVAGTLIATTEDVVLARYNPDGSPDSGFGAGGTVQTDTGRKETAAAIAIQPDGKIVVVGTGLAPIPRRDDFLILRYTEGGAPDGTFGTDGIVYTDFVGRIDDARAVVIQPDGKIVAAGRAGDNRLGTPFDFALARYLDDGSLDGTFGTEGRVRTVIGDWSEINGVALQVDGKIVAAGWTQGISPQLDVDIALAQYNSDGSLDKAFGTGGIVTTDVGGGSETGTDVDVQRDGKIVVSASPSLLVRYRYDSAHGPFGGSAWRVPGRIEAEDYDLGGQDAGYFDTTPGNEQGVFVYRTDEVDIKLSSEGGHTIGWFAAGEWLAYTARVERDGLYAIEARVGSVLPGRTFHVEVDGIDATGPIAVPQVRNWDGYETVTTSAIPLQAGRRLLRVVMGPEDFMDLQWIAVVDATAPPTGPFGGVPWRIPGRIEAEDYDLGGNGLGYLDTTRGNEQGAPVYRNDDVDIKTSSEGGYAVGWFAAGEWLNYTVDVRQDGLYTIAAHVGSVLRGRTFHIEIDGVDVTGPIAVPRVRAWDRYRTVRVSGVPLRAGTQVVRVVMGPEDFMDLQWIAIRR